MRWLAAWVSLILAMACSLLSLLADPYTAWGVEQEQVRPGPAAMSVNLALISLALLGGAAWLAFRDAPSRRSRRARLFAVPLAALAVADAARVIWIRFYVLA